VLTAVPVGTAIATAPWYYPNDAAAVTAPNGGGTPTVSVAFSLYGTAAQCSNGGSTGWLYPQTVSQPASGSFTVSTSNTTVHVLTLGAVYWRVAFSSTNSAQNGRNGICTENVTATLASDTAGTRSWRSARIERGPGAMPGPLHSSWVIDLLPIGR
jgi:hypothetical protein